MEFDLELAIFIQLDFLDDSSLFWGKVLQVNLDPASLVHSDEVEGGGEANGLVLLEDAIYLNLIDLSPDGYDLIEFISDGGGIKQTHPYPS